MARNSHFGFMVAQAWVRNQAIITEQANKQAQLDADADLRLCVFCEVTTHAYICPECHDYKGLTRTA